MKPSLSRFSDCKVLVVGDTILDVYFMGEVRRISPEAPVPIVHVKEKSATLGGAGNVALNVVGLGAEAILVGVRGDDVPGNRLEEILRQQGICGKVIVDPTRSTTSKTRIIGHGQQLLRLDEEETNEVSESIRSRIITIIDQVVDEADAIVLSDYDKGVLNGELPQEVVRRARSRNIPVLIDPKRKGWERYSGATCVTPNTAEVEVVTGIAVDSEDALLAVTARSLRKQYDIEWCLVTRGAKGMCLLGEAQDPLFIKASAREVFDVSGAGDTVIATMAVAVGSGLAFPDAARLANMAAGIVVGKLGSQAITKMELEAAMHIDGQGGRKSGASKITGAAAAQMQVKAWRAAGESIIYTDDCFDNLTPTDIHLLREAKELGDRLVVGIESEKSEQEPMKNADQRHDDQKLGFVLSALECVDLVVVAHDETTQSLVAMLKPDVLVMRAQRGLEGIVDRTMVESYGGTVHIVPPPSAFDHT